MDTNYVERNMKRSNTNVIFSGHLVLNLVLVYVIVVETSLSHFFVFLWLWFLNIHLLQMFKAEKVGMGWIIVQSCNPKWNFKHKSFLLKSNYTDFLHKIQICNKATCCRNISCKIRGLFDKFVDNRDKSKMRRQLLFFNLYMFLLKN